MGNHMPYHPCRPSRNPRHPISSISQHRFSLQSSAVLAATWELQCLLSRCGTSDDCQAFEQYLPPLLSEDGRSPQVTLNVPATQQLSVAFLSTCHRVPQWKWLNWSSSSTYLGNSFVIMTSFFYSVEGQVKYFVCQVKLRTTDEIKRRIMKSIQYLRRTTTKIPFQLSINSSAALSIDPTKGCW